MINLTDEVLQIIRSDNLNWEYISKEIILSEEIIREFKSSIRWKLISQFQILSEEFMREFKCQLSWDHISEYQVLSDNFIGEFKNKINFVRVYDNKNIPLNVKLKLMLYYNNTEAPEKLKKLYQEFLSSVSESISDNKIEAFVIMNKLMEE